jgi:hypothetical protein
MSDSTLFLNDDHLILDFPYDPAQVAQIKRIAGARWDKLAKVWRVPMTSLNEAREFATEHGFAIENDVLTFTLPTQANQA